MTYIVIYAIIEHVMTTNTNNYPTIGKPHLEGVEIYIDGALDKQHQLSRYASYTARACGYVAFKGLEGTLIAINNLFEAARQ